MSMAFRRVVAKNVAQTRIKKGLSQAEAARRCGLATSQLNRIEKGAPNLTVDIIYKLAKGLDVPPATLLARNVDSAYDEELDYDALDVALNHLRKSTEILQTLKR